MSNNEDELYKKLGRLEFEVEKLKQSHEDFKTIIVMVLIGACYYLFFTLAPPGVLVVGGLIGSIWLVWVILRSIWKVFWD